MGKAFCWVLVIMLSISLSQSEECSCPDINTDEETLTKLRHQVEFLNSYNDKLLQRIEMLSARLGQNSNFADAQNTSSHQTEPLHNANEDLLLHIKTLAAQLLGVQNTSRLNEPDEFIETRNQSSATTRKYPRSCAEIPRVDEPITGFFFIKLEFLMEKPFIVFCNDSYDGGWTVIQRREDGSVDFYRNWTEYKNGFGNLEGEFFIGLDKLYALTNESPQELLIHMTDFKGETRYAKYNAFAIDDESHAYALSTLGKYSGNAGDSLKEHHGHKFSTKDRDNDISSKNCAEAHKGAWWYADCRDSNLNGLYLKGESPEDVMGQGITWFDWLGYFYPLKYVQMMIRPIKF